ncbi:predicted protein [Uncinocarpus reesii 1704]|uniref:Uncharacterized protein n=1 Tax=Uncinocarpus reesii (strain UAMH 1704) TaxID=336963 RepID=C4JJC0_UNCRE|nr:uncharacterized protein UREG_01727 [Uncinocarpus reesii 1704]EEP76878.1 predicted protein [Uncinocarpus reesii 1704]
MDPLDKDMPTNGANLKTHKALPRKRDLIQDDEVSSPAESTRSRTMSPLSNGFTLPKPVQALPLTPPSLSLESKKQSSPISTIRDSQLQSPDPALQATPTRKANLLTPDITPPRVVSQGHKRPPQFRNFASMSSKAESFKTAREVFSSDDDVEATKLFDSERSCLLRGYDNSIDSDQSPNLSSLDSTPPVNGRKVSKESYHFGSLEGHWKENGIESSQLPKVRNKQRHRSGLKSQEASPKTYDAEVRRKRLGSQPNRERSLRERVKEAKKATNRLSIEEFGKEIGWFSIEDRDKHSCDLSGVSATSTIEAVIIDSPPRKKQTLRHTGKAESLRSVSSPVSRPPRDTSTSRASEQSHRLVRRNTRITNQDRLSVASDNLSLASTTTCSKPKPAEEIIPVVVIPQRRSSLRSSACGSREHSRTRPIPENRRPSTAPEGQTPSRPFDVSKRRRTMSESEPRWRKSIDAPRCGPIYQPRIPVRRSSLSASTSRNPSRTASLTSDNLQRYQQEQEAQAFLNEKPTRGKQNDDQSIPPIAPKVEQPEPENIVARENSNGQIYLSVETHCNDSLLQTPSLPKTPFQPSIQSLSPGPIEISEARAVPFFAHNNKSLLVVEQYPQTDSQAVQRLRTSPTDLEVILVEPRTPVRDSDIETPCIDSPLRNPRAPPKPPVFKIIPPTPAESNNHQHYHLPSSSTESSNGFARRWDSLRHSFSAKRHASVREANQPVYRFRNRKAGKEIDGELHPFWRPRGFWDDFKDSDLDGEPVQRKPAQRNITGGIGDVYIGNSLGIPQSRIFQGPLTLIRRVSNRSRRRKNASHTSILSATLSLSGGRGRDRALPHLLSVRELQNWLTRTRRRRERRKLEAKRNKLRHMIGEKVAVDPNLVIGRYNPPPRSAFDS